MLLNRIDRLLRLDSLISKGSTGTPTKLATKLNLSVRQVYRIIKELLSITTMLGKVICMSIKVDY
jgi:predicted DNA-binding transcriptional regulator YafY